MKASKMLEVSFGEQTEEFLSGFLIFVSGVSSVEDVECSGHPSTNKTNENMYQVKERFLNNRIITIHEVSDLLGISFRSLESNWQDSLNASDRFLLLSNVPAHCVLSVHEFVTKNKVNVFIHPSCSPDLAPCDFLSLKLKIALNGKEI
jgi:hypothetical protein